MRHLRGTTALGFLCFTQDDDSVSDTATLITNDVNRGESKQASLGDPNIEEDIRGI